MESVGARARRCAAPVDRGAGAPRARPASGCSRCSAARRRSATTSCATPSTGRRSPRPTALARRASGCAALRRRRSTTPRAGRRAVDVAAHRPTASSCSASRPSTSPRPTRRSRLPETAGALADLAEAALEAALAIARAEVGPDADRTPARGHRDGQVRRARAELRQRRRRHLRRRAGRRGGRGGGDAPSRTDLATRLMRICSASTAGGHALAGRRRRCGPRARTGRWCAPSPATAPTTSAGPRPGSSRRCSRRARSPATPTLGQAYVRRACSRWCGRPPSRENFVDDVQAMRRRVEQHIPARRGRPRSSSSAPGGLRDVEFAVQLLQLVHGRADESLRTGTTLDGARGAVRRRLRRARRRRDARHGLPAPAHARAPDPAVPAAAHPPDADGRRATCAGWAARSGTAPTPARGGRRAVARPAARGAPAARAALLPPAALRGRPAVRLRRAAHPGGGAGAAGGARLPRPARRAAAPRGAHRRASAGGPRSSARCCR